jgi:hypothetical protein
VLLAARGARMLDWGTELINDSETRSELRNKARSIQVAALVGGLLLTAIAFVITR